MPAYYYLDLDFDYSYCVIDERPKFKDKFKPACGQKMGSKAPKQLKLQMSDDYQGIKPSNFVLNTFGYYLINDKVKQIVENNSIAEIEYIPFKLINHKGRVDEDKYYIMNVIGSEDCVDRKKTIGEVLDIAPDEYMSISKLVLDDKKIPSEKNLFRISAFPQGLIIRSDLKDIFQIEGITGIKFLKLGAKVDIQ